VFGRAAGLLLEPRIAGTASTVATRGNRPPLGPTRAAAFAPPARLRALSRLWLALRPLPAANQAAS
jgi:hypothetical protein